MKIKLEILEGDDGEYSYLNLCNVLDSNGNETHVTKELRIGQSVEFTIRYHSRVEITPRVFADEIRGHQQNIELGRFLIERLQRLRDDNV